MREHYFFDIIIDMEIIKYKKLKDNIYELELDNGSILKLFDDTIMHFSLLLDKKIDNLKLEKINKYNEDLKAYYLSLKYINKKLRSKWEVKKYLEKEEYNTKTIDITIEKLEQEGYLNNQHYINSYINDQFNLTNNGPDRIKYNLIKLGFAENDIDITHDFSNKIKSLIAKKVKLNHKLSTISLKINITNYLVNLGYPKEMFDEYLDDIKSDDAILIKKDYELLKKKYSKKYKNDKLKYFIKDKLYKKGYNIDEINEVLNETVY